MNNDVEVMVYVSDINKEAEMWESIGFEIRDRQDVMIQVAASEEATFALNIFDLDFIKETSPEVANNVPSIMFHSDDIDALYARMQENGIEVGELVEMGLQKVFNFANTDGLYFAVSGI